MYVSFKPDTHPNITILYIILYIIGLLTLKLTHKVRINLITIMGANMLIITIRLTLNKAHILFCKEIKSKFGSVCLFKLSSDWKLLKLLFIDTKGKQLNIMGVPDYLGLSYWPRHLYTGDYKSFLIWPIFFYFWKLAECINSLRCLCKNRILPLTSTTFIEKYYRDPCQCI